MSGPEKGRTRLVGNCRISPTAAFNANSGAFSAASSAASVFTLTVDTDVKGIAEQDVFIVTPEDVAMGSPLVTRLSATQIEVRLFDDLGAVRAIAFAVDWYTIGAG